MKYLLSLLLLFAGSIFSVQAQNSYYDPSMKEYTTEGGGTTIGHNTPDDKLANHATSGSSAVTVTVNGKVVKRGDVSKYAACIIGYELVPGRREDFPQYESIGEIVVTSIQTAGNGAKIATWQSTPISVADWQSKVMPMVEEGVDGLGVMISYPEFYGGGDLVYFEVVVVNKETGYCATTGPLEKTVKEYPLNIIDPTQEEPSNKPTIDVLPLALCWMQGGTFDLTGQVTVTPADATVTYYDTDGTTPITNQTQVAMPAANANNTDHKTTVTYYAKASNSDGESELKPIVVTIWQKPEVKLAVKDKTNAAVCNGAEFTLQTTNVNSFVPKNNGFHYRSDATLDVPAGDTYKTSTTTNATYKVIVTSGDGVGNCVDSASVNVTVIPTIPGTAIQITSNLDENKKAICDGESLTLTASVTGSYSGTITYNWTKNGADFGKGGSKTDSPTSQTSYAVSAELDGCPSNGVGSLLIEVNPLPPLSVTNPKASCGEPVDITQTGDGTFKYYTTSQLSTLVSDPTKVGNGTYYVTKTVNGCVSEAKPVTATVYPLPTPQIAVKDPASGGTEFCAGTELILQCNNAGYDTYTWSGGDAVANNKWERKVKIATGTGNKYSLTVTDGNNCQGTSNELTFTGKAAPTVTIDQVSDACAGSEVTLTARPVWVSGNGTVAWTGNVAAANAATTTATLAGKTNSYSVTVTDDNKCTATANVDVYGNELKIQNVIHPNSVKFGNQVSLDVAATWNGNALDDTDATYSWKKIVSGTAASWTASTKKAVDTPDNSATYQVTVSKEGCSVTGEGEVEVETDPFEVTAIASVGNRVGVCDGEELSANPVKWYVTASGGRKSYTYAWTVPDGMTVEATDADTLKITAIDYDKLTPGPGHEVSVAVSDGVNTATQRLYFEVRALPEVQINDKTTGGTVLACQGVETNLTASVAGVASNSGDTYLWDGGSTSRIITVPTTNAGTTDYTVTATYAGCSNSATISVTVNALPDLTVKALLAGNEVDHVCPGTEITLQAAVAGGDASGVKWRGAATGTGASLTSTVNNISTYIAEYKDNDTGCSATKQVTMNVHTPATLAISANPGTTVCAGSPVVLTASNGATYRWSDGNGELAGRTNDTLMIPQAINMKYIVNGTDANGCEATHAELTIQLIEAPKLVLKDKTMHGCQRGEVDLADARNTSLSTLGLTLKVKKADGTVQSGTKVSEAGTYTLYLDAGNDQCSSNEEKVEVIFHDLPTLRVLANLSEVCSGEEVTLTAESDDADTPTFTYNGTPGTSWTVKPANSGSANSQATYTVTAENSYRCRKTADATVTVKPLPNVQIEDPGMICAGSEITLTATGATSYSWEDNGGTANGDKYTVRPSETNNVFTVLGTANGCTNTASRTLNVKPAPTLEYADNNGELTACLNTTVDLKTAFAGSHPIVECFTDDQATTPLQGGGSVVTVDQEAERTYYVREKVGDCVSELKPVKVKGLPVPTVNITADDEDFAVCVGTEVTLMANATGAAEYTWSPGNEKTAAITVTPTATTTYKVTVKSTSGCSAEATQALTIYPKPALAWNQRQTTLPAGGSGNWSVTLNPSTTQPYTYTWTRNSDEPVDSEPNQSSFRLTNAQMPKETLAVYVTDGNGCRSDEITDEATVTPVGGEMAVNVTATDGRTEICRNGVQVLTAGVSGGQSPYSYVWYKDNVAISGETAASITVSDAATYKVSVKDAGGQIKDADLAITVSSTRTAPTVVMPEQTILANQSTVLLANVTPEAGNYTYQWAKAEDLKDASQVNLAVPETKALAGTTNYTVLVKDEDSGCYAQASSRVVVDDENGLKVLASASANTLCQNSEVQLSADVEGSAAASATYSWRAVPGLSATNIKNPVFTATIAGTQEFVVTVAAGGRMAAAKVSVTVNDNKAPKLILSLPDQIACSGDKITVRAEDGTVSGFQWFLNDQLVAEATGTEFTLNVGADQKVRVTATAENGCEVKPVENTYTIHGLPEIAWDNFPQDGYSTTTPLVVSTKFITETQGEYLYHWLKPNPQDVPGNLGGESYSEQTPTADHYDFEVYVTDLYGCQSNTLSGTVNRDGSKPIEIEVKDTTVCAAETVELAVKKLDGPDNVTYLWEESTGTLSLENANQATVTVNIAGKTGLFNLKVTVADANNPDNKKEKPVWLTIADGPDVSIADRCVALHKDSVFVLTIANPGDCDYLWRESVLAGDSWSAPEDKGDEEQQTVKMGDQDMRYILVATKDGCRASDTAMIYRIPDAPTIGIDTNTTRINIKLEWSEVASNDGYTVWSRKWDPYCMTGGGYESEIQTTESTWAEAAMDTLEFYYVTADRRVCGTTYHSLTSDTVGYYLMDVKVNTTGTSLEWYPLYFDMRDKGIVTSQDFLEKNLDVLSLLANWEYGKQVWGAATIYYDPKEDDPESTDPIEFYNVFDLPYESVIRVGIAKNGQLLQYGKLPKPIQFNLKGTATPSTRFSCSFIQPFRMDLKKSSEIIMDLDMKVATVVTWNFASQAFNASTIFYDPKEDDPESTDPIEFYNVFPLKGLLPIRVGNETGADINWK